MHDVDSCRPNSDRNSTLELSGDNSAQQSSTEAAKQTDILNLLDDWFASPAFAFVASSSGRVSSAGPQDDLGAGLFGSQAALGTQPAGSGESAAALGIAEGAGI